MFNIFPTFKLMVPYWSNCHVSGILQKTQEIMFLTFIMFFKTWIISFLCTKANVQFELQQAKRENIVSQNFENSFSPEMDKNCLAGKKCSLLNNM